MISPKIGHEAASHYLAQRTSAERPPRPADRASPSPETRWMLHPLTASHKPTSRLNRSSTLVAPPNMSVLWGDRLAIRYRFSRLRRPTTHNTPLPRQRTKEVLSLYGQLAEQFVGLHKARNRRLTRKLAVDRREDHTSFCSPSHALPKSRQAERCAQLPEPSLLSARAC